MVWGLSLVSFIRWFRSRPRGGAPAAESEPARRPPRGEAPPELLAPPPRPLGSSPIARAAVARYRVSLWGLVLLAVPPLGSIGRGGRFDLIAVAISTAMGLGLVLWVESSVRAVRRLLREGTVVDGTIRRIWRGRGASATVAVELDVRGQRRRVAAPVWDAADLEVGMKMPVLAQQGRSLAALVAGSTELAVGRLRGRLCGLGGRR